jgi:hypothetical protein
MSELSWRPSDAVWVDGSWLKVKRSGLVALVAGGNATVVGAVAGKKIRLVGGVVQMAGSSSAQFRSGAGGSNQVAFTSAVADQTVVLPRLPSGWAETVAGEALVVNAGGGSAGSVVAHYVEV